MLYLLGRGVETGMKEITHKTNGCIIVPIECDCGTSLILYNTGFNMALWCTKCREFVLVKVIPE